MPPGAGDPAAVSGATLAIGAGALMTTGSSRRGAESHDELDRQVPAGGVAEQVGQQARSSSNGCARRPPRWARRARGRRRRTGPAEPRGTRCSRSSRPAARAVRRCRNPRGRSQWSRQASSRRPQCYPQSHPQVWRTKKRGPGPRSIVDGRPAAGGESPPGKSAGSRPWRSGGECEPSKPVRGPTRGVWAHFRPTKRRVWGAIHSVADRRKA